MASSGGGACTGCGTRGATRDRTDAREEPAHGCDPDDARPRGAPALSLTPWFLGLALTTVGPILGSLYLSFTDYSLLQAPEWIGLDNYRRMLDDTRFWTSLKVTFTYVFVSVPLQLAFALALALVLNKGVRGLSIYRSVYYLPSLVGSSVAIAILWRRVFGAEGLVNAVLEIVGIQGPGWVSHPDWALSSLIVLNIWTFGSPMIIFLAGLRQIPREYYEAAAVDGAGALEQFRRITLPLLTPIIFFNLVLLGPHRPPRRDDLASAVPGRRGHEKMSLNR